MTSPTEANFACLPPALLASQNSACSLENNDHPETPFQVIELTSPPGTALEYRQAELLMHYLDCIFQLQFRFYTPDPSSGGRGWLLWLLTRTRPLYHAALSLSALHQYGMLSCNTGNQFAELMGHHARALENLQRFLQQMQEGGKCDDVGRQIAVLSCGVMLISFELFRGGCNDWRLHLDALTSISALASHTIGRQLEHQSLDVEAKVSDSWTQVALRFLIPVLLWFDLLACASTGQAPRMPYRTLVESSEVDLESTMGCQNWVMGAIGDIAQLNAWKSNRKDCGQLSLPTLVSKSQEIQSTLEHGLELLSRSHGLQPWNSTVPPKSQRTALVTRLFAAGALVQLHAVTSGAYPGISEIRSAVSRAVAIIESIQEPQMVRGLVWPICISACLAETEMQPFFHGVITATFGSRRDFGNCSTILQIIEACWRRREMDQDVECDWKRGMDDLGICALMV
ncbi:hypothetical protein KC351_g5146 [Hortaea werneckii]|nr:hypothetical protein KC351_g5146 [Hortaea werneckii]